jgi:hypothetical protein
MLFTIITVFGLGATLLGLAFHRFRTTRPEARSTIIYASLVRMFFAWLLLRAVQMRRRASPRAWQAYLKGLPLWRQPALEKWLFLCFYASFLYLAASGFFFAVFVPRGLFGYPLIAHVMAGGLFAACLTLIVLFKGRDFIAPPRPASLSLDLLDPRKIGLTEARVKRWAFWLFAAAGCLLVLSALLPMLPLLRTAGQRVLLEIHRYGALIALLAAVIFAGLSLFEVPRPADDRQPPVPS